MFMINFKRIGKRIKTARNENGFTQEAFSEILGITTEHLSRIETGSYRPSLGLIEKISSALDIPEEVIMFGDKRLSTPNTRLSNKIEALSADKQKALETIVDLMSE